MVTRANWSSDHPNQSPIRVSGTWLVRNIQPPNYGKILITIIRSQFRVKLCHAACIVIG